MKKEIIIISIIALTLFGHGKALAQPDVVSASGEFNHGGNVTIIGSSFGSKSPAAPLVWDTCESGNITDTWRAWPNSANAEYNTAYRTAPFRSVNPPHSRSNSKFIAGGHDPAGYSPFNSRGGPNVEIVIDGLSSPEYVYISFYNRVDPNWPTQNHNWKMMDIGQSNPIYGDGYWGTGACNYSQPFGYTNMLGGCNMGYQCQQIDQNPGLYGFYLNDMKSWFRREFLIHDAPGGFYNIYHDNDIKFHTENCDAYRGTGIGYIGIGGYWRKTSAEDGDVNAFEYWDDIYIDTTFSRVVLANDSNYSNATIIEPQIPSAWSSNGNSITCTVNLGKLADSGTAYLFVFDANNNHNPVGYAVEIGGSGGGGSFPGVGNSLELDMECKICSNCGHTSDEFFQVCPACGKKCGSQ